MSNHRLLTGRDWRDHPALPKGIGPAVLFGLVLLLGAALRLYDLGAESYWIDEMYTLIEARQSIPQMLASGRFDQPPAFYLPFHFWVQRFGPAEASTRAFSALVGIASIVVIYLIGRELFGHEVGLLSAFLMAISEFQIRYSQMTRFYIYFELMTLFSFFFLILALKNKRTIHLALYTIASMLMVFSHSFGVFVLAAQNLFFILQWKRYKHFLTTWLVCQALVLLAIVPYFLYVSAVALDASGARETYASNIGDLPVLPLPSVLHHVYGFVLPNRPAHVDVISFYAVPGALLVAGTVIYALRQGRHNWTAAAGGWFSNLQDVPDVRSKVLLLSCWLLCPIVLPYIISVAFVPVYKQYYAISAAPALCLLLGSGMFSGRKVVPLVVSLLVLVLLIGPGLHRYYVTDVNEQWMEAAAFVEDNSHSGDVIVFAPSRSGEIEQRSFNWYYRGDLQECGLDAGLPDSEVPEALTKCISDHERFWVITKGTDPLATRYTSFFLDSNQTAMHLLKQQRFVTTSLFFGFDPLISVYLFEFTP